MSQASTSTLSYFRSPSIILFAVITNIFIFYLIQQMVNNDQFRAPEFESVNLIDFIRLKEQKREPEEIIEEEIIQEPPPLEEPPPPPEVLQPEVEKPELTPLDINTPELDVPLGIDGTPYIGDFIKSVQPTPRPVVNAEPRAPTIRTDIVPTIKIPPNYPRRALRSGIEGVVTVELTITKEGSVKDPVILEANPPKLFNKAVLKAIVKWKFNPQTKDGKVIELRTRQVVNFKLKK